MKPVPSCLTNGRSGDVIVFLHRIGGNAAYWKPQLFFGSGFKQLPRTYWVMERLQLFPK